MITRRGLLRAAAGLVTATVAIPSYAIGIEPLRLVVTRYRVQPDHWPAGLKLTLALLADPHACHPWMSPDRIAAIATVTNQLGADTILLLGDYVAGHHWVSGRVASRDWAAAFAKLKAPFGVHAILGNHDWWDDRDAQRRGKGPVIAGTALEEAGIPVLRNQAIRLNKAGQPFWLAGLDDQLAILRRWRTGGRRRGVDDLPATLAQVTDDAPIVLMAHEPDIFWQVPERVALTVSGHTHGGQIRMFGYSPVVPSRYGNRFAYGHVADGPRHLVISGGLGCSIAPVRLGLPPEIVVVELGGMST